MVNSNSINVTACDNELYIIACNGTSSFQLCHIQSGFHYGVNVNVNIQTGNYIEPPLQNGLYGNLDNTYTVNIPSGTYSIMAVGIDWGGGQQAQLSVTSNGGQPQSFGNGGYKPGPTVIPNIFWTYNGAPLTTITV